MNQMISDKIIENRLNLFLLHNENDRLKEQIKVKNNIQMIHIISEIEKKFNTNFTNIENKWISVKELINFLENLPLDNSINYATRILDSMKIFKSTMSKLEVKISNKITNDLVYIVGVIIGDGCLSEYTTKKMYPVYVCGTNENYIKNTIKTVMNNLFNLSSFIKGKKRENKSILYEWIRYSKPLYRFFSNIFEIPIGKKSHKVLIPKLIKNLNSELQISFLTGLFDTDWGYEYYTFGSGCVSRQLLEDAKNMIEKLTNIENLKIKERPLNAKSGSFSLIIPKKFIPEFYRVFRKRLKNAEKIRILENLMPLSSRPVKDMWRSEITTPQSGPSSSFRRI